MKIILLDHQNNYTRSSNMTSNVVKNFNILGISMSVLHNYFNSLTKLFLNLYPAKFLNILAKCSFHAAVLQQLCNVLVILECFVLFGIIFLTITYEPMIILLLAFASFTTPAAFSDLTFAFIVSVNIKDTICPWKQFSG